MKHTLKTHPAMFRAVRDGVKPFEVRKDDRAFQTGDVVRLTYYDPDAGAFPAAPMPYDATDNREPLEFRVTFVLRGGQYGIEPGFVVLGLAPMNKLQPNIDVRVKNPFTLTNEELEKISKYQEMTSKTLKDIS